MLICLAELHHGIMSFSVSQVDDILNPHTLYSRYVALPSAYSQFHLLWPMWEDGVVSLSI